MAGTETSDKTRDGTTTDLDVVVIGAGPVGENVADRARQHGLSAVAEAGRRVHAALTAEEVDVRLGTAMSAVRRTDDGVRATPRRRHCGHRDDAAGRDRASPYLLRVMPGPVPRRIPFRPGCATVPVEGTHGVAVPSFQLTLSTDRTTFG